MTMNPNFALTIDCYKITNWLEERKKLPNDWQKLLKAAETKMGHLVKQQSDKLREFAHIHKRILDQTDNFTYKDLAWVCQELKKTRLGGERNLINQYTNPILKEWLALKAFMDKNMSGTLNLAKFINQILKFEIPGLKKSNESIQSQIAMLKRKIDSNNNIITLQKEEFKKECKNLGIKGEHIRQEIPKLIEELPNIFRDFQRKTKKVVPRAWELYSGFCSINGAQEPAFSMLKYFLMNGDDVLDIYQGKVTDEAKKQKLRQDKYKQFIYKQAAGQWGIIIGEAQIEEEEAVIDTLLSCKDTRTELLFNLNELLFFLRARSEESKSSSSKSSMLSSAYAKLEASTEELAELIREVNGAINCISSQRSVQLLNLAKNPSTFDRIVRRLEVYGQHEKKCLSDIERLKQKIIELEKQFEDNKVKIEFYKSNITEAKKVEETLISGLMKRETKIVGDINKVEFM